MSVEPKGTSWNAHNKQERTSKVSSEFFRNSISQHMLQDGSVNLPSHEVDAIIRNLSNKEKKINKLWWALGFAAIFSVALFALTFASALAANEKSKESHVSDGNIQSLDGTTVGTNEAASYVSLSMLPEMPMSYIEKLDRITYMHKGELRVDHVESAVYSEGRVAIYIRGGQEKITVKCGVVRLYDNTGGMEVSDIIEDGESRRLEATATRSVLKAKAYSMAELQEINARFNAGRALEGEQALYDLYEFFGGITTSTIAPDTVTGPPMYSAAGEEDHCSGQSVVNRPDLTVAEADAFFQTAAVEYCNEHVTQTGESYDGTSPCSICADVESGALKFSTVTTFQCANGNSATQSMAQAINAMWVPGAQAQVEEQCQGVEAEDETSYCPSVSYSYFAFAVLQDAANKGSDGGLMSFGSVEDMCAAFDASGLEDDNGNHLTYMMCEKYSAGGVDEDTEFEYRCEGSEDVVTATFGDMWQAGHQRIDGYFDAICGEDGLRHLAVAGDILHSEDATEDFGRMLWGSPPPPPRGGQLGNCCGNSCFGRCGPGCTKWTWVCGTDNNHQGCQEHDYYCSCVGMWHWRCVSFFAGPGTCWFPGCAATKCDARNGCWSP